jgi:hypothetical protein
MAATKKVLAVSVLNVALVPAIVLVVRVDRTVSPLVERVLKRAVAPVSVLTLNVLVVRVLIVALFPRSVLVVRVLIVAVAVVRLGRARVLVASVLKVAFMPVSVLT